MWSTSIALPSRWSRPPIFIRQPVSVETADGPRLFCCTGCSAASQWIGSADLGEYYRLRETLAGDATVARVDAITTDYAAWDRDAWHLLIAGMEDAYADHDAAWPSYVLSNHDGGAEDLFMTVLMALMEGDRQP